jgi:biotin operon repressor
MNLMAPPVNQQMHDKAAAWLKERNAANRRIFNAKTAAAAIGASPQWVHQNIVAIGRKAGLRIEGRRRVGYLIGNVPDQIPELINFSATERLREAVESVAPNRLQATGAQLAALLKITHSSVGNTVRRVTKRFPHIKAAKGNSHGYELWVE